MTKEKSEKKKKEIHYEILGTVGDLTDQENFKKRMTIGKWSEKSEAKLDIRTWKRFGEAEELSPGKGISLTYTEIQIIMEEKLLEKALDLLDELGVSKKKDKGEKKKKKKDSEEE